MKMANFITARSSAGPSQKKPKREKLPRIWIDGRLTDGKKKKGSYFMCQFCLAEGVEWREDETGKKILYEEVGSDQLHLCSRRRKQQMPNILR